DVAGPAVHEQEDDAAGLRGEVRPPRGQRVDEARGGRAGGGAGEEAVGGQQPGQGDGAEGGPRLAEELAARLAPELWAPGRSWHGGCSGPSSPRWPRRRVAATGGSVAVGTIRQGCGSPVGEAWARPPLPPWTLPVSRPADQGFPGTFPEVGGK